MRQQAITIICLSFLCALCMRAQGDTIVATTTIVDHIITGTDNTIVQPEGLLKRLFPIVDTADSDDDDKRDESAKPASSGRPAGYRVQVFSDNNPRTAKAEASSKERIISARFPQYQAYVRYNAPYWRLRVGDFRTQQEADHAAEELRKAFPAYSKEIRVVRDRITLPAE